VRTPTPSSLRLYAAVPAGEAHAACPGSPGLRAVSCGPIAALVEERRSSAGPRAALRHDRIIGRALLACSAVVPFRFGTEIRSAPALRDVLAMNLDALSGRLAHVRGRVEMGLKVTLPPAPAPERWSAAIERVRALAPSADDRRERLLPNATGHVLEGCYLITREAIDAFWAAVEAVRAAAGLPVLGSGPWAAYSFCELALGIGDRRRPACAP
jgi:hypothetical protein